METIFSRKAEEIKHCLKVLQGRVIERKREREGARERERERKLNVCRFLYHSKTSPLPLHLSLSLFLSHISCLNNCTQTDIIHWRGTASVSIRLWMHWRGTASPSVSVCLSRCIWGMARHCFYCVVPARLASELSQLSSWRVTLIGRHRYVFCRTVPVSLSPYFTPYGTEVAWNSNQ